ncbi:MAG: hypothetical protein AAF674_15660 [Pseudomonadota bacterium]
MEENTNKDAVNEVRLMGIETVLRHVLTVMCVKMPVVESEHFKKTLYEHGPKIDRSSLSGPTDQEELEAQERVIRAYLGPLLELVEEHEIKAREANRLPQVQPTVRDLVQRRQKELW